MIRRTFLALLLLVPAFAGQMPRIAVNRFVNAFPAFPPAPPVSTFVTGQTLGSTYNLFTGYVGFKYTNGASPINITGLRVWKLAGDNSVRTAVIMLAGNPTPVAACSINMSGEPVGYVAGVLSSPYAVSAGATVYIMLQVASGVDTYYNDDTTVTTTAVGSMVDSAACGLGANPADRGMGPNVTFGPLSFDY